MVIVLKHMAQLWLKNFVLLPVVSRLSEFNIFYNVLDYRLKTLVSFEINLKGALFAGLGPMYRQWQRATAKKC